MNISALLTSLIALVKADANKAALPAIATFFTNIASNPSSINIVAQLAKLEVDLIAALPGIEQAVLQQLATTLNTEAQALVPSSTVGTTLAAKVA